ncbi:protein insensitive isoform X2 [Drosophila ficusphila]|uniref:protein insensitive isoform X2 n=1 Tax=Drosophila ficusphila TaxID=30025 RepID=UPI0007E66EBB|nr:protein insensitive isoform X2 [Drosophila ficusphila]
MDNYQRIVNATPREDSQFPRSMPLVLNAWSQTSSEDFELLRSITSPDPQVEAENRALRDKVRYLEAKLQQHTDLLSQIHATSARMQQASSLLADSGPPTPPTVQNHQILTPPSSVICAPTQNPQILDYKIISAPDDADAIEIRLAAESLNSLSTSSDSDRLEICLGDENQPQNQPQQYTISSSIKREGEESSGTPLQFIKRRKLQEIQLPEESSRQHLKLQSKNPVKVRNGSLTDLSKTPQQNMDNVMVSIGPNGTCVPASVFENINWSVSSLATRKLLVSIFDRETLATHSMTGKPSPAFKDQDKPLKRMLDPQKIQDIIFAVTHKCNASEKEVRNAITTKCADENKMMKIQTIKRRSSGIKHEKENISSRI